MLIVAVKELDMIRSGSISISPKTTRIKKNTKTHYTKITLKTSWSETNNAMNRKDMKSNNSLSIFGMSGSREIS